MDESLLRVAVEMFKKILETFTIFVQYYVKGVTLIEYPKYFYCRNCEDRILLSQIHIKDRRFSSGCFIVDGPV